MLVTAILLCLLLVFVVAQAVRSRWAVTVELPYGPSAPLRAVFTVRKVPFKAAVVVTNLRDPYDKAACVAGASCTVGGVLFKVTRP